MSEQRRRGRQMPGVSIVQAVAGEVVAEAEVIPTLVVLWIAEDLQQAHGRQRGHTSLLQPLRKRLRFLRLRPRRDRGVQLGAGGAASGGGAKRLLLQPLRVPGRARQRPPLLVRATGDRDPAVVSAQG